jgi:hypothetical protein
MRRPGLLAVLLVISFVVVACGGGSDSPTPTPTGFSGPRPTSTGTLTIVSPTNGDVIHGSTVNLKLDLKDAKIVPITSTDLKPNEGHIHVTLDDQLISMTTGTSMTIPNVPAGHHIIQVEYVATDHGPFNPRVTAAVAFDVKG